ncbi:cupredoxin domain-containing protein [Pseudomonas moorei]|uniref:Plastocyanin n=1 Tax=Pseudomonas moorei TaxID=395599 RepID=A0A1H1GWV1_9PSED|nr:cupredoxin family copper-binding protein [Pseudomonas moorei]KAB0506875.1 amidase [Pseudomonas moorei]PPA01704.1 amidase [Pseudomonas sp. MWU12-2312b]PTU01960.1 amidase [Pseudomonas sp. HMWF031]SDR17573.1 Plastocyanin [Pseudomonas moorei]
MKARLLAVVCLLLSMPVWAQEVKVDIKEFMFGPKDLNVAVGTKVTWVNDDEIPHTVAETHKLFRSGALDTGDSYSWVFNTPGEYEYFCALHPQMLGKIVVSQ